MRRYTLIGLMIGLAGCGDDDGSKPMAEIGWEFNYVDYTNEAAVNDVRLCDNQPALAVEPPYRAVEKVRVVLEDPDGIVPGVDTTYDCELGVDGKRVPIRGLVRQVFALTLEARAAGGTVLYQISVPEFDLSSYRENTYRLLTATGELHFFPTFAGSVNCGADVAKFRYSLFRKEGGTPETRPSLSGVQQPACEDDGMSGWLTNELFIREIPVTLDGIRQTYNDYELKLEALDAGDTVKYCRVNPNRVVRLADTSSRENEDLSVGSCPP